jgi:hypothetical protein
MKSTTDSDQPHFNGLEISEVPRKIRVRTTTYPNGLVGVLSRNGNSVTFKTLEDENYPAIQQAGGYCDAVWEYQFELDTNGQPIRTVEKTLVVKEGQWAPLDPSFPEHISEGPNYMWSVITDTLS